MTRIDSSPGVAQPHALPSYTDTIVVRPDTTGDYKTIQAAINAAADSTTILLEDGIYTGNGNRDLDTLGKMLLITSRSGDPASCVIDCQGSIPSSLHRGFDFHSGESAATVIASITIRKGAVDFGGGGVCCVDASPAIVNCVISDCRAMPGPAVYLLRSNATFQSCRIVGNWDPIGIGGAIQINNGSAAVFNNCVIRGNGSWDGYGSGGVQVRSATVTMTNCDISGNYAMWSGKGGGIAAHDGSTAWLSDCTIADNHLETLSGSSTPVRIAVGAGVYALNSQINLLRCTINNNSTRILWGPIELAGNAVAALGSSTVSMDRTITSFNWAAIGYSTDQPEMIEAVYSDAGSNIALAYCDIYGNAGGDYGGAIAGLLGVNGNISSDPLYCDAGTGVLTLDTASPCIISGGPAPPHDAMGSQAVACSTHEAVPRFVQGQALSPQAGSRPAAAWGDYDNDGDDDLFVVRTSGTSALYRNDGSGLFVDVTASPLDANMPCVSAAWGDYDDDGDLDLYLVNDGAPNRLIENLGGGTFADSTPTELAVHGASRDAFWCDFDNDGDLDLYLIRDGSANMLFRNHLAAFAQHPCAALEDDGAGVTAAIGDYDRDGDQDLYLVNRAISGGGPTYSRLMRNDGDLAFTEVTSAVNLTVDCRSAIWGDFDNDQDLDLYVVTHEVGNHLFRNNGPAGFDDYTLSGADLAGPFVGASWIDFDRDGDLDLYVMTDSTAPDDANVLLRNDLGVFIGVNSQILGVAKSGFAAAIADLDGEGHPDLFMAAQLNQDANVNLVHNQSSDTNRWIAISLRGSESNAFGIGANVAIYNEGRCIALHEIGGGSSPAVKSSLTMTIGLGQWGGDKSGARATGAAVVDSLKVSWPSGIVQVLRNVAVDARLVIHESAGPQPAFPGWQMHQRDMHHTGRADFTVPTARMNCSFFDLFNWQTPTPDSPLDGGLGATSMVFADGAGPNGADIVVGGYHWPKGVQGMDRHTGEVFWAGLPNGGESIGDRSAAFAPDGQSIYVTNDATDSGEYPNGRPLMAFAAATGPATFRHNGADSVPGHLEMTNPVIAPDGRVFLHQWWQRPHAGTDGASFISETWAAQTHLDCLGVDVALYQGDDLHVIAGGQNGGVVGYSGTTGAELWREPVPSVYSTPTIDPANGHIYVPSGSGDISITGLNRFGQPLWSAATRLCHDGSVHPQRAFGTGCLSHDGGTYYFQTSGQASPGLVYAIDTATGTVKWAYATGSIGWDDWSVSCPIVTRNGVVIVGNNEGDTYFALLDSGDHATLLDTLAVEAVGNARASATLAADGQLYLPLRTTWTVAGGGQTPTNEVANLFCSLDLIGEHPYYGSYSTDFDSDALGQTLAHPGSPNQGGWFQVASVGAGVGEIQGDVAMSGRALHEHAPASNQAGTQTADARDLAFTLVGRPYIVLSADFLAHGSQPTATNPYSASLMVTGGPHPGYQIVGFSVTAGNGDARIETGCNVALGMFNGIDNNDPVPMTVGQGLDWDAWHQVEVAIDHGSGKYLYVEVDGHRQYLVSHLLPRSEVAGEWLRGGQIDRISAEIVSLPWEQPNQTDDDIYWDNIALRVVTETSGLETPTPSVPLALRVVPNPFNAMADMVFELQAEADVSIRVYDVRGRLVRDLISGRLGAGRQRVRWEGRNGQGESVAAGIYLVRVTTGDGRVHVARMALVK